MEPNILERKNLQPQRLRDLKVLQNLKKVGERVEDPTNFPRAQNTANRSNGGGSEKFHKEMFVDEQFKLKQFFTLFTLSGMLIGIRNGLFISSTGGLF